jgi:hypothetical protein
MRGSVVQLSLARLAVVTSRLLPVVVILSIWVPIVDRYTVNEIGVSPDMVESARALPSDAVLAELREFDLLPIDPRTPDMEVAVAEGILRGELAVPGLPSARIGLPFMPDDLDGLPSDLQLFFGGFIVPDFLLAAYETTGREEFYNAARDTILAWGRYEQSARLPKGYLWNDHAIAARVRVLAEFWRTTRQRPDFRPDEGRPILQQAARYLELLSDPGQFQFASNHGLMQNLGLLHLLVAFPTLPESDRYLRLALDRLDGQLRFLIDDAGVFRENSAGYQPFDLELLGMILRSMTLLGVPVPEEWSSKYEHGLTFLDIMERPDGTLPSIGDTDGAPRSRVLRVTKVDAKGRSAALVDRGPPRPQRSSAVFPAAGYGIQWDGLAQWPDPARLSQTVVTWTRPPAPSHKHADELSLHVWKNGVSWLTAVGYWPYFDDQWAAAQSWTGANAPHLVDEAADSDRTVSLVASGSGAGLSALSLERHGPGSYRARRDIVQSGPDLWVVVDSVSGDDAGTHETIWTIGSGVVASQERRASSFMLQTTDGSQAARIGVAGSAGTVVEAVRGSRSPLAGWQVVGFVPQPVDALRVEQPGGDASAVFVLSTAAIDAPDSYAGGAPELSEGNRVNDWTVRLPIEAGWLQLTKTGDQIDVEMPTVEGSPVRTLQLQQPPDVESEMRAIDDAFDRMAVAYPVFQPRQSARLRVSAGLAAVLVVQELLLLVVTRLSAGLALAVRLIAVICWLVLGAALYVVVLPPWSSIASVSG